MRLEPIKWKFASLAGDSMDLKCAGCDKGQAVYLADIKVKDVEFNLPVCEGCAELTETELLKRMGGQNE